MDYRPKELPDIVPEDIEINQRMKLYTELNKQKEKINNEIGSPLFQSHNSSTVANPIPTNEISYKGMKIKRSTGGLGPG